MSLKDINKSKHYKKIFIMCSLIDSIPKHFCEVLAPCIVTFAEKTPSIKYFPLSRIDFFSAANISTLYAVQTVTCSIFLLLGNMLTCGLSGNLRASLSARTEEAVKWNGALLLGLLGIFMPQTVNEKILKIPPNGLILSGIRGPGNL